MWQELLGHMVFLEHLQTKLSTDASFLVADQAQLVFCGNGEEPFNPTYTEMQGKHRLVNEGGNASLSAPAYLMLFTDASSSGWGAYLQGGTAF